MRAGAAVEAGTRLPLPAKFLPAHRPVKRPAAGPAASASLSLRSTGAAREREAGRSRVRGRWGRSVAARAQSNRRRARRGAPERLPAPRPWDRMTRGVRRGGRHAWQGVPWRGVRGEWVARWAPGAGTVQRTTPSVFNPDGDVFTRLYPQKVGIFGPSQALFSSQNF